MSRSESVLCRKCGLYSPRDARFCDSCGTPLIPLSTTRAGRNQLTTFIGDHPILTILCAFVGLIVLAMAVSNGKDATSSQTTSANAQQKQLDEDKRGHEIALAAIGAASIKRAMRDPDSFKLTSALIVDKTGAVCYDYRARNGFNGMNVGHAVLSPKGAFKTDEMDGFAPLWNKECAHRQGTDQELAVSALMNAVPQE